VSKIYILKGLPGCGKTTRAKELLKSEKKILRINKDDIRGMAQFGLFNPTSERMVVQAEYDIVDLWASKGFSVIVDDTNLNPVHSQKYEEIANKYPWVTVEYIDMMDVPVDKCIANDLARKEFGGHYVGRDNIINMGFKFKVLTQTRPCVVSDMDGTISDPSHRRGYVRLLGGEVNPDWKPDWIKFFESCDLDTPRMEVISQLQEYASKGYEIIICSARPEDYRDKTEKWLKKYNVPYDRLIMRRHKDYRKDTIVKQEFLDNYLDKTKILKVFDDRPCVIRDVWRAAGLDVVDCGDGIEF
jgi:predicted kinase